MKIIPLQQSNSHSELVMLSLSKHDSGPKTESCFDKLSMTNWFNEIIAKINLFYVTAILMIFFHSSSFALEPQSFKFCTSHNFTVTLLKINLYDIRFCNNQNQKPNYQNIWSEPFAIIIKYNKNISKNSLVDASIDEIKKYNQIDKSDVKNIAEKLSEIFPEVSKNDEISALYFKGSITLEHNHKKIGNISNKTFAKQFIDIWLNPKNEFEKMRFDLLNYEK